MLCSYNISEYRMQFCHATPSKQGVKKHISNIFFCVRGCAKVWLDYKLRWNPEKYDGIKVVRIPYQSVWRPDILLYNK